MVCGLVLRASKMHQKGVTRRKITSWLNSSMLSQHIPIPGLTSAPVALPNLATSTLPQPRCKLYFACTRLPSMTDTSRCSHRPVLTRVPRVENKTNYVSTPLSERRVSRAPRNSDTENRAGSLHEPSMGTHKCPLSATAIAGTVK